MRVRWRWSASLRGRARPYLDVAPAVHRDRLVALIPPDALRVSRPVGDERRVPRDHSCRDAEHARKVEGQVAEPRDDPDAVLAPPFDERRRCARCGPTRRCSSAPTSTRRGAGRTRPCRRWETRGSRGETPPSAPAAKGRRRAAPAPPRRPRSGPAGRPGRRIGGGRWTRAWRPAKTGSRVDAQEKHVPCEWTLRSAGPHPGRGSERWRVRREP